MTLSQYFICFIIYSFLGWVYESLFYTFQFKKPVNTGFLRGCICPIYGIVCVMNIAFWGNVKSGVLIFFASMITVSVMEYIVSYVLEHLFKKRWWDYSDWPLNINGRISLISSVGFGAMSLLQLRLLQPTIMKVVLHIPPGTVKLISILFIIAVVFDLYLTIRDMDKDDDKLWFVDEESDAFRNANEKLEEKRREIELRYSNVKDRIKNTLNR